ncbi:hypothetical protein C8R46DRAFT_1351047 [Mycena filopes]|nr:hypothetical protein C8R46DRAFT_1351047 [Mycena filopes]
MISNTRLPLTMSVFDPPSVLEIMKACVSGRQKFATDWKAEVETRVRTGLSGRKEAPQLRQQLEWEANVVAYVNAVHKLTTVNGNNKSATGPPALPKGIPLLGPKFLPPGFVDVQKRNGTNINDIRPLNIVHPFYYPNLEICPQCSSADVKWKGWTGAGSRDVHGIRMEEKALGYQLRCDPCSKKYGQGGTDFGARNPNGEKLESSFATTNAIFWERWEHWKIPRGIPYFMYRSALTRELFDFIVELRPSTTAGRMADNIKHTSSLTLPRHLEYLNAFKTRLVPRLGLDTCVLTPFSAPDDLDGYNDKSITDDLITDVFLEFSNRTRLAECSKYLRTLHAVCMVLDQTYRAASKATVVDAEGARTKMMKGGILSILNELNEIVSWRFCQSGSATEIIELVGGFKARLELMGIKLPEMVTVDNCCTVGNKIREVLPDIKVLLDVYHFIMRYAAGDIKEAILKVPSSKGVLAQYWSQDEQKTRLAAAYNKWAAHGVWSAAAQNIHIAQMQHVTKGCLARPREDIASDGSRIEGSHKGWNSLQRSFASGLEMQTALGHDFVLRRNIRVALNGKAKAPTPFVTSTFGSHHISLVDYTAEVWNELLAGRAATSSSASLLPLPRLPDIPSGEKFGLVNSPHTDSFGGLFTIKEEPEDDPQLIQEIAPEEQERLMAELHLTAAQFLQPERLPAPAPTPSGSIPKSEANIQNAAGSHSHPGPRGTKRKDTADYNTSSELGLLDSSESTELQKGKKIKLNDSTGTVGTQAEVEPSESQSAPPAAPVEHPALYSIFNTGILVSNAPKTRVPPTTSDIKSIETLTARFPQPEAADGIPKLTASQRFFSSATGTDPRSLAIHQGQEFFLFMDMRREFGWKSYDMNSRKWVTATTEYNSRLRRLPGGNQFIAKNPRALLEKLGEMEPKIATRLANNNFTSAAGKTAFWTLHCHAVSFVKTESKELEPNAGTSADNAPKPSARKLQTCTRCKTIKYPGGSGAPENHKLVYCSDGFRPVLKAKDEVVPAWPLPTGIFTNGVEFHPLVFLSQVRDIYETLVIQKVEHADFSMEEEAFFRLLESRVVIDELTGAVMFKMFKEFNVPAADGVPDDMYVEYKGAPHLYINSLSNSDGSVAQ